MTTATKVSQFLSGHLTLAELEGIPKSDQYEMATVGYTLLTEGRIEGAERVFLGLHALDPYDAYFLTALGSIAQRTGRFEEAEGAWITVLEKMPDHFIARYNLAKCQLRVGKIAEAGENYDRLVASEPGRPELQALAQELGR